MDKSDPETSGDTASEIDREGDNQTENEIYLEILSDLFPDSSKTLDSQPEDFNDKHSEPTATSENNNEPDQQPTSSVQDLLALLSQGGISEHQSDISSPCSVPDFDFFHDIASDNSIDWETASSKAMLQIVQTDHPYLSHTSSNQGEEEEPFKTTSCSSIPDAELIHDFFVHTTNMIAYQPIGDIGNHCRPVHITPTTLIGCPELTQASVVDEQLQNRVTTPDSQISKMSPTALSSTAKILAITSENASKVIQSRPKLVQRESKMTTDTPWKKAASFGPHPSKLHRNTSTSSKTTESQPPTLQHHVHDDKVQNTLPPKQVETKNKPQDAETSTDKATLDNNLSTNGADENNFKDTESCQSLKSRSSVEQTGIALTTLGESEYLSEADVKALWTAECKAVFEKVQEESLLNCALTLLLKGWENYMSLTFEDVQQLEIDAAREMKYSDEVVEMLEDKDRYVWQIIEEMEPRDFSVNWS